MDTNQNVDNSDSTGDAGKPSQTLSQNGSGSINDAESKLAQLLDAKLEQALKPVFAEIRGVQGKEDRNSKAFKEFLDEYKKQKATGLSDTEAESAAVSSIAERTEVQKDKDLLRQIAEKVLGSSPDGNGTKAHADIVKSYGFEATDPDVIRDVLSQTDPKDAEIAALRLTIKRQNVTPPSPSAASTATSKPTPPANVEQLTQKYVTEVRNARGNKTLITSLREKYKNEGVDVYSVDFT